MPNSRQASSKWSMLFPDVETELCSPFLLNSTFGFTNGPKSNEMQCSRNNFVVGTFLVHKIYSDSFGQDEKFFKFYRSMLAYENTFSDDGTTMLLSPDSDFFSFFGNQSGN